MPTPEHHVAGLSTLVSAALTSIVTFLFDIPEGLVGIVFIGAVVGLWFRPAMPEVKGRKANFKQFLTTCGWLLVVTMLACWLIPWATNYLPLVAQKSLAAFAGLALMLKRERIQDFFTWTLDKLSGRVQP